MYHFPIRRHFEEEHEGQLRTWKRCQLEDILNDPNIPIGSNAHLRVMPQNGVVKIENHPIHIIMERSTGKTMECYVEFKDCKEAKLAVSRVTRGSDVGLGPRMGIRHVDVSLSSPDMLMKAIFPLAKCIRWKNGRPIQVAQQPDEPWSTGFKGFLTPEEMFGCVRHAENPGRSSFSNKVPPALLRVYVHHHVQVTDSGASLQYPWAYTKLYTVQERNLIFRTLRFMIEALVERIDNGLVVGLSTNLVLELVHLGLHCPAFNPRMKFCLAYIGRDVNTLRRVSEEWLSFFPFDTLTWLPPYNPFTLGFYAYLIANGTAVLPDHIALVNQYHEAMEHLLEPYGRIWYEWDESKITENWSFADCVEYEAAIMRILLTSGFQKTGAERAASRSSSVATAVRAPSPSDDNDNDNNDGGNDDDDYSWDEAPRPGIASFQTALGTAVGGSQVENADWDAPRPVSPVRRGRGGLYRGPQNPRGGAPTPVEWRRGGSRPYFPARRGHGRGGEIGPGDGEGDEREVAWPFNPRFRDRRSA
ncbi:hypothetical protein N7468_000655 [Penicillium chermesinum]|uniref:Uncharacterized protein n=1 Tax=Penicillium chermesinum TaxID=63820 RepID=A0A9W9PNR1_9EURO|nr:uncharacterized protein N7468_000655 [Penicillium chermesinum]KAJ5249204.1 hypothetical protein N7468_000655 [Penicillium chermesinum]